MNKICCLSNKFVIEFIVKIDRVKVKIECKSVSHFIFIAQIEQLSWILNRIMNYEMEISDGSRMDETHMVCVQQDVLVLESHDRPGGAAHSFKIRDYEFKLKY